jgi:hypothetical protein
MQNKGKKTDKMKNYHIDMSRPLYIFGEANNCKGVAPSEKDVPLLSTWKHVFSFSIYNDQKINCTMVKFNRPVALDFVYHLESQFQVEVSCIDDDLLKIEKFEIKVQDIENKLLMTPFLGNV